MKRLIEVIIKKWFRLYEWELVFESKLKIVDDWGDASYCTVRHYFCKECWKYKKIKSS